MVTTQTNRKEKIKVYADNSTWNSIAFKDNEYWCESNWSKKLIELVKDDIIEIYVSPTNCMELAIYPNNNKHRNQIALAMNTLADGLRMLPTFEDSILEEMLRLIDGTWQNSVSWSVFKQLKDETTRNYIGLLGQLAALENYNIGASGYDVIVKSKLRSQLIHLHFLTDKNQIENCIKLGLQENRIDNELSKKIDELNIVGLKTEIKTIYSGHGRLKRDSSTVNFFNKHKQSLIALYSKAFCLDSCAESLPIFLEQLLPLINYRQIVKNWEKNDQCSQLRNVEVNSLEPSLKRKITDGNENINDVYDLFEVIFNRFHECSFLAETSATILIEELANALKSGYPPTEGLVFDSEHILGAVHCDIFLCKDGRLYSSAKSYFDKKNEANGSEKCIVRNLGELENALKKLKHSNN